MLAYKDRVRVKEGFYSGQIGTVMDEEQRGMFTRYLVLFDLGGTLEVYQSEVEKVDGKPGA